MQHDIFMQRALQLAMLGIGHVSPNPLVGCVIVKDNIIIGEGWHQKYGGLHAEPNAVNNIQDKSLLNDATVYVNLEPCAHFGKTPPCANLLAELPIKEVVIANIDPNPLVAGKGIEILMAAGKEVQVGVLEKEAAWLNRRFFHFITQKRPYMILKWAETADGFIARENNDSKWISNELSRTLVHKWRTEEDSILVGTNTAMFDNPTLNARHWEGRNPTRLLIDKELKLPTGANLLKGTQTTIVYNQQQKEVKNLIEYVKIDPQDNYLDVMMADLYQRKIQSVIVEGGAKLLSSFIKQNLWDEARIFKSPILFKNGIHSPDFKGIVQTREKIQEDELSIYLNPNHVLAKN